MNAQKTYTIHKFKSHPSCLPTLCTVVDPVEYQMIVKIIDDLQKMQLKKVKKTQL